jgi:hypothetical protein
MKLATILLLAGTVTIGVCSYRLGKLEADGWYREAIAASGCRKPLTDHCQKGSTWIDRDNGHDEHTYYCDDDGIWKAGKP